MFNKKVPKINVALVGHVDHGKSTVLGRLLADTGALPEGKLDQVKDTCRRNSKPFEYAFLIDALKEEQSQGITIDSARVFYETKKGKYIFIDAPGHIDFLKNMVTGAARAEAAFLVIDALEGIQENSRRHGVLLSMLGVKQVVVLVNKMDLVQFKEERFEAIKGEYESFLKKIDMCAITFIPVSGIEGDSIAVRSSKMQWYRGKNVMEVLGDFKEEKPAEDEPFRMFVQGVYKFTKNGDDRRIIAGTVSSGKIHVGDELIFYPSGKKNRVKSIEAFNEENKNSAIAGDATGFTLEEQIYVTRGELAINNDEPRPKVTSRVKASIFWLGDLPMVKEKEYVLKVGTTRVAVTLERVEKVFDSFDLDKNLLKQKIGKNMFAECVLKTSRAITFDLIEESQQTGRFVIVDDYNICGGGIIRKALEDKQSWVRNKALVREYKWEKGLVSRSMRSEKYGQEPAVIFVTGKKDAGKKIVAKRLEEKLFKDGRLVYFMGIGNLLYGVDADIKGLENVREEHLRRLAEVSHIILDSGMILIVTAIELSQEDIAIIKSAIGEDNLKVVWVGKDVTTDIGPDLLIEHPKNIEENLRNMKKLLIKTRS